MERSGTGPAEGSRLPGDEVPWELLDGYFAGTSAQDDRARVNRWIEAAPEHRRELESIRQLWLRGAAPPRDSRRWDTEHALAALARRIEQHEDEARTRRASRWPWRRIGGLVAAAVAGIGIGSLWRVAGQSHEPEPIAQFSTAAHQRANIKLRDGTTLTLGSASRLRIPPDFGRANRVVELDGEALFTVKHDPAHPFEIRTSRTVVRDLGTTFDVLAYATDAIERVVVLEGQVSVVGTPLAPRDVGTIDAAGHLTLRHNADVKPFLAWSDGSLAFADAPLSDAVRALDRSYELTFVITDPVLAAQRVTATFVAGTPIDVVLGDLTAIVGATYRRSSDTVEILRRGVDRPSSTRPPSARVRPLQ